MLILSRVLSNQMEKSICIFRARSRLHQINIPIAYSPLLCMFPPPTPAIISPLISLLVWLQSIFLYQRVCLSVFVYSCLPSATQCCGMIETISRGVKKSTIMEEGSKKDKRNAMSRQSRKKKGKKKKTPSQEKSHGQKGPADFDREMKLGRGIRKRFVFMDRIDSLSVSCAWPSQLAMA